MTWLRAKRRTMLALLAAVVLTSAALLAAAAPDAASNNEPLQGEEGEPRAAGANGQEGGRTKTEGEKALIPKTPVEKKSVAKTSAETPPAATASAKTPPAAAASKSAARLPDAASFKQIAESGVLQLKADPETGHFIVADRRTGESWQSFPNPDGWDDKKTTEAWKLHLQSPFMFRYVELNVRKDLDIESDFTAQGGKVASFEAVKDGFNIVYELPGLGFVIPVQVRLKDDCVETRIVGEGLTDVKKPGAAGKEDPQARLVAIRLFPFLGAETSEREDGFLFIPDGPGALIDFKKDQPDLINYYNERVYGEDWAFSYNASFSSRQPVRMPVFGIKSGHKAVLAIIEEGEAYASVLAVPSRSFSQYNWAAAEHQYRFKFFQPTDTRRNDGFFTYNPDLIGGDRVIRYYFLSGDNPGYVEMAGRYRTYLTAEGGLSPLKDAGEKVPLHLNLLGADTEKGFLWDSYLPLTTTDQAKEIVQTLNSLGVEEMSIAYMGWQKGGYSAYGGHFPVAGGLGGAGGMKTFVDYAHAKGFPVYLDASSYSYNNTGRDGFRKGRDGLRDLSSAVIEYSTKTMDVTLVNPQFMADVISGDLADAKKLGVDGLLYGGAIGAAVNSDFNSSHPLMRQDVRQLQESIMKQTKEALGSIAAAGGNFYAARYADHLSGMYSDYSYDMFVDRIVPFAQIALHGLVSYSHDFANLSGDYMNHYLKGIEYGAEPSFLITYAPSQELMKSRSLNIFYSTNFKDWTEEMVSLYQRYNEALSGVRGQFIAGHRMLAQGVFETEYAGGRRIIVNYNETPYSGGGVTVQAKDFVAAGGA